MKAVVVVALVVALAMAGCNGGGKRKPPEVVLPPEITEQDLGRLNNLASKFPTAFTFEGQEALAPVTHWINDTLGPGTGSGGVELPTDDGPVDYGSEVISYDVSDKVPVGQPVEVRVNLKWWGEPGRAADMDIWVDMPGDGGAVDSGRFDESNNWNIGNKIRVVNSVHLEGEPFLVGIQVTNGRIVDPTGSVPYSMKVEFHFVANVLPPATPFALQVPDNSTLLVIDTERVIGDEHVDVDFVLVGPDDKRVWAMHHNDIGQETLSISLSSGGEYILYAQRMHGGFLRVEAEVPNENHVARQLELVVNEQVLYAGPAPAPGTFAEQGGASSNTYGAEGSFDVGPSFPLDVVPVLRYSSGPAEAAVNITSPDGWLVTAISCYPVEAEVFGPVAVDSGVCASYSDERGRAGGLTDYRYERRALNVGTHTFGVVANGPGVEVVAQVLTYTR